MDTPNPLRFGTFELDVRSRELRNGGVCVRLQEQPLEILRLMLERPGDVDHPRRAASASVARGHVRRFRAQPQRRDQAPARGARRRCRQADVHRDGAAARLSVHRERARRKRARRRTGAPSSPRVRLVVLPFSNLSDDSSQEYFSDGLTEELIAQLGPLCRGQVGIIAPLVVDVLQGQPPACARDRRGAERGVPARGQHASRRLARADHRAAGRSRHRDAVVVRDLRAEHRRLALGAGRRRRTRRAVAAARAGAAGASDASRRAIIRARIRPT